MNLLKLAWKNITSDPLNLFLNLILLTLGIGLINFIFLMDTQLKEKFEKNLGGVNMVIGAKGSPLQLILSSMYHIDAPTGNISIKEAKPFLREGHPLIETSVPLSMGDSHKGYRIIGTDHSILPLYGGEIAEGKLWNNLYDVTIGSRVAKELNLEIGSQFVSSHGFTEDVDLTHDHGVLTVVGVLKPTGSVLDLLILVSTESVWAVHDHQHTDEEDHDHDHEGHDHSDHDHSDHNHSHSDHDGHDHDGHDHDGDDHDGDDHHDHSGHNHEGHDHSTHDGHDHGHDHHDHEHEHHDHANHNHQNDLSRAHLLTHEDKDITSLLVKFKNKASYPALNFPRNINENTDMQAASPAIEMNRLYDMMGVGTRALQLLAVLIAIVSALSIFVSLLNSLKRRKYELSLLRVMGGKPSSLLTLILMEGLILAFIGFVLGMVVSNLAMSGLGQNLQDKYNYEFSAWQLHGKEGWLLLASLVIGLLAALWPAIMAYKTDIHKNLSEG